MNAAAEQQAETHLSLRAQDIVDSNAFAARGCCRAWLVCVCVQAIAGRRRGYDLLMPGDQARRGEAANTTTMAGGAKYPVQKLSGLLLLQLSLIHI